MFAGAFVLGWSKLRLFDDPVCEEPKNPAVVPSWAFILTFPYRQATKRGIVLV
jgi:hypothetical protein